MVTQAADVRRPYNDGSITVQLHPPSYLSAGACETILDFSSKYFLSAALVTEKGKYIFYSVTIENNNKL